MVSTTGINVILRFFEWSIQHEYDGSIFENKQVVNKLAIHSSIRNTNQMFNPLQPGVAFVFRGYRKATPGSNELNPRKNFNQNYN